MAKLSLLEQRKVKIIRILARRLKKLGYLVGDDRHEWVSYQKGGTKLEFRICEKMKQGRVPLNENELRFRRLLNDPATDKFGFLPTGFLKFEISSSSPVVETKYRPFEDRIEYMVERLVERLDVERARKIANDEQQRRWAEASDRHRELSAQRAEEERHRRAEDDRWKRFVQIASEWRAIQSAREFLDALQRDKTPLLSDDQVAWLRQQIALRDPLGQHRNLREELKS